MPLTVFVAGFLAASAARLLAVAAQAATTVPEAPSSISGGDQARGALVLGLTLVAMGVLVVLAMRGTRRRSAIARRRRGEGARVGR
ncbi:MAG: hypothetical protein ACR2HY_06295 [Acidimicrobiales bacterium]